MWHVHARERGVGKNELVCRGGRCAHELSTGSAQAQNRVRECIVCCCARAASCDGVRQDSVYTCAAGAFTRVKKRCASRCIRSGLSSREYMASRRVTSRILRQLRNFPWATASQAMSTHQRPQAPRLSSRPDTRACRQLQGCRRACECALAQAARHAHASRRCQMWPNLTQAVKRPHPSGLACT